MPNTDFTHTGHLDRWDESEVKFILGLDAHAKAVRLAETLSAKAWKRLEGIPKYEILTELRDKPARVKEAIAREKGFENIVLVGEDVADMAYRPCACANKYRLVIVRKSLSVQRGGRELFEEVRNFYRAVRALGFKWIRMLYALLQSGEAYDGRRLEASLRAHRNPYPSWTV